MMRAKGGRVPKAGHNPKGGELEHQNKTASALPKRAKGGRVEGEELGAAKSTGRAETSTGNGRPKNGPAWAEGLRNGTQISHTPGSSDAASIEAKKGVGKVRTFKTGGGVKGVSVDEKPPIHGAVEAGFGSARRNPFPKMTAGGKSGEGRMEKMRGAKRGVDAP